MTFEEYREFYISSIKNTSLSDQIHEVDAFIEDIKDMIINDFNITNDFTECQYEWRFGNKAFKSMKIDAYDVDSTTNTISFLIADYNPYDIKNIINSDINTMKSLMLSFFENCLKGFFKEAEPSANATQASYTILNELDRINKVRLIIISTNKISDRVKNLTIEPFIYQGKTYNVKLDVIDFDRIYKIKAEGFDKEDVIINTNDFNISGIPSIKADLGTSNYDSYLAVIPGEFLADIYDSYGPRLLESNVRSFLSFRGGINKGIRGTILNCKENFFTYNNGISATANEIETKYIEGTGLVITKFVGLQIINGGQTTASLASTRIKDKASLKGIFVQMKLTVVKESDPEFLHNIAKFANSQNKVTNADLNSNHPFYTRIEELSRKIYAPMATGSTYQELWFFERARGQYEQPMIKMSKAQRESYQRVNPKSKKFTKIDLAKFENSANMLPHYVSWGGEVNSTKFQESLEKSWKSDSSLYNEYYYKELIGKAIICKSLEKIISNQEWYQEKKAYRPQLIAYTFSKLVYELSKNEKIINYKKIWDNQSISNTLEKELVKISKLAFDNIYSPTETANISTYCKKKICWERLRDTKYQLEFVVESDLLSKEEREVDMSRAKREQKTDEKVDYAMAIYNKGYKYWESLIERGTEQGVLSNTEISFLETAKKSCKTHEIVSNKQAPKIKMIVKKLEEYGIK